jgi:hypothetical protein
VVDVIDPVEVVVLGGLGESKGGVALLDRDGPLAVFGL